MEKIHRKIAHSEETAFVTPMLFRLLNNRHDKFHKLWEFWEISPKQMDENQKQSQIIIGERLPSQRLSLITKIILIIFTTANDSPNLAHRSFDGF